MATVPSVSSGASTSQRSSHAVFCPIRWIFLISFFLLGCCSSEAFASGSVSSRFVPHVPWTRGGARRAADPNLLTCRLHIGGKTSAKSGKQGAISEAIAFAPDRNGAQKNSAENYVDAQIPASFIAETNLPTDVGQFRLRAYRHSRHDINNEFLGNEPSVIYAADKPPFGHNGDLKHDIPIRIHDQCLTSEVFGSQRYERVSVTMLRKAL